VAEYSVKKHPKRERSRTDRRKRKDAVVHEEEHRNAEERSEEPGPGDNAVRGVERSGDEPTPEDGVASFGW
jgi:hypothetical protein